MNEELKKWIHFFWAESFHFNIYVKYVVSVKFYAFRHFFAWILFPFLFALPFSFPHPILFPAFYGKLFVIPSFG